MNKYVKRYFVDALGGMASGLFATLIIGLIIKQIGSFFPNADALLLVDGVATASHGRCALVYIGQFLVRIGQLLTVLTGAGIAVGTAHSLGAPKLAVCASLLTGTVGAYAPKFIAAIAQNPASFIAANGVVTLAGPGDPLSAFVAALVGAELGRLVCGKTKVDIMLVVPGGDSCFRFVLAAGWLLGPTACCGCKNGLANGIQLCLTELHPVLHGYYLERL